VKILLTNDDGIGAKGIEILYSVIAENNRVSVVAPKTEQSGVSHAFTYHSGIHCKKYTFHDAPLAFEVSGTPSDCVKLAVSRLLDHKPDIIVSGMNIGENSGISGFYSGTLAAAREGAFWKIPSFAFSICDEGKKYMLEYAELVPKILTFILHNYFENNKDSRYITYFNINFPGCSVSKVKGLKCTRQSMAFFDDRYVREVDENGLEEFHIFGEKVDLEKSDHFDSRALLNDYITITPLHFDATAEQALAKIQVFEEGLSKLVQQN